MYIPAPTPSSEGLPNTRNNIDLTQPIVVEEVKSQLKRLHTQRKPGLNGVTYYIWKYTNDIYNRRTPESWKTSNTILTYSSPQSTRPMPLY